MYQETPRTRHTSGLTRAAIAALCAWGRAAGAAGDLDAGVPDPVATTAPASSPGGEPGLPEVDEPPTERWLVTGWAVARGTAQFVATDEPPALVLPEQRAGGRLEGLVRARYQRGGWLAATVSGHLAYDQRVEANDFYGRRTFGVLTSELRELEVSVWANRVSLHLGQQRVAWGISDLGSPNDVLNARDLRDPVFTEDELRYLPTPMARLDYDIDAVMVQLVAGLFVPDEISLVGEPWSVVQPTAPVAVRGLFHQALRLQDPTVEDRFEAFVQQTSLPRNDPRDATLGARISAKPGGADLNAYYQYGYDGTPFFKLDPDVAAALGGIDWATAKPSDFAPLLDVYDAGRTPYSAVYLRRHHVGLDALTTLGDWGFRLDGAYQSRRVFYHVADLSGFASPIVDAAVSAEYQTGDLNRRLILQLEYLHLFDFPGGPLLGYRPTSLTVSGSVRWPIVGKLTAELEALVGVRPRSVVVVPRLEWKMSGLTLIAKGLYLGGESYSLGGYFHDATGAMLGVKLTL